jgi:hypothetical protein
MKFKALFCFLTLLLLSAVKETHGNEFQGPNDDLSNESTLKALFVYNFTKHIDWSTINTPNNKFVIVVTGKSDVTNSLISILKNRKIQEKPIEIIESTSLEDIQNAQILFVTRGTSKKLDVNVEKLSGKGILIVTEEARINAQLSCINIIETQGKLSFEINESNIKKSGIKISSQLRSLARNEE